MKTQLTNLLSPVSKADVRNLTTEVKETLAKVFSNRQTPVFSAAQLWNIQRQHVSLIRKRRFV